VSFSTVVVIIIVVRMKKKSRGKDNQSYEEVRDEMRRALTAKAEIL
jgi:hypothetical protein